MRKRVHLNFDWQYIADIDPSDIHSLAWESHASKVDIPHTNRELPYNNFDERAYQFQSAYRKQIAFEHFADASHALLRFEGVMSSCQVFFNRVLVGEHHCGYLPFEIDLLPYVKKGQDNEIIVVVDASEDPLIPPFGHVVDYLTYGGIYREVELILVSDIYVKNARIHTAPDNDNNQKVHLAIDIANPDLHDSELNLEIALCDLNDQVIHQEPVAVTLSKHHTQRIEHHFTVSDVKLWELDNPALYKLVVHLSGDTPLDTRTFRFGFRTVAFKNDGFYLNGKAVKLIGLNRHQSYPYVGYAMPQSAQARDAELMKFELGCNCVRSSHYPPSSHFLNRCDEIGLLVFNEIPGWQHIGEEPLWQQRTMDNVQGMIERDVNHPSVFIWGVRINESPDHHDLYKATNVLARQLDPSRPTGGVRCIGNSELLEDVYTYNDFSHTGNNEPLQSRRQVAGADVPYLVTEHCGHMFPTKPFDSQDRLLEQALRHARVLNKTFGHADYCGAIGWSLFDYNTHEDFGSGDRICYHGVLDMFREPKYAAAVYASQQDEMPVMELAGNMKNGDYAAGQAGALWVFTNCDSIKLFKNDRYIQTFYPDKNSFPHLPHPPVVIDDFIGDQIAVNEPFSPDDAETIRQLFSIIMRKGQDGLNLWQKAQMFWILKKNRQSIQDGVNLFLKYVGNWGDASASYRIEGYKHDQCVIKKTRSKSRKAKLNVKADQSRLQHRHTYDVTRITVQCVDEDSVVRPYANDPIQVEVSAGLELMGPDFLSLTAGRTAFWVRTRGVTGHEQVRVKSSRFGQHCIELNIELDVHISA
ncbi:glycoside hydrolase family 2 TIM barrel-domain containing protein [Endozoicomonas sp. ALB115]|uniref:glycoside hydrolase family 2 protein n=1 Tax=Endozoicomonas sp. ALB115 TaxID=3403074 RepID=UPI003BB7A2E0